MNKELLKDLMKCIADLIEKNEEYKEISKIHDMLSNLLISSTLIGDSRNIGGALVEIKSSIVHIREANDALSVALSYLKPLENGGNNG